MTKRVQRNRKNGEVQLLIRVTGEQDVYRFASMMLTGQVEFAEAGYSALKSLKRQIPAHHWMHMLLSLGGPATLKFRASPRPPAPPQPNGGRVFGSTPFNGVMPGDTR